jgi:hypothetical protein
MVSSAAARADKGTPRDAYLAGLRGDLPAVAACLRDLDAAPEAEAEAAAWRLVLRWQLWFGAPRAGAGPSSAELADLAGAAPAARAVAALACAQAVRAHVLAFDVAGLDALCDLYARIAGDLDSSEARSWLEVARGWRDVVRGQRDDAELDRVVRQAAKDGYADLVIEAEAVRALGAANAGDLDAALKLARRASRMARTEAMPQHEYLAHLVLARVRRVTGKPHLATRILAALLQVATPPWRPWLAWELLFANGRLSTATRAPHAAPDALARLLDGARAGDRMAYEAAAIATATAVRGVAPLVDDLRHLLGAIDPGVSPTARAPELEPFCEGHAHHPPRGLLGVCGDAADAPQAWVLATAGAAPRRILAPGDGLARAFGPTVGHDAIDGKQIRTDSAIALLALAGAGGLDEDDLFLRLYGFAYEPERHQSVRSVLYTRVKKRLGDAAELERTDGRLRLAHAGNLLVPDPRCTPPPELRILRWLAERRQAGARDVAASLGIPLRTAQDVLHRLAEDGALRAEKHTKGLHYFLDDTTFSEPTRKGPSVA